MIARLEGTVVHGKGNGRKVGMPTANLKVEKGLLPAFGVYASRVTVGGKSYVGVTNIGLRPSVDRESRITVETWILDFDRMIYGEKLSLDLVAFLRPTRKMQGLGEVKKQVDKDARSAREIVRLA